MGRMYTVTFTAVASPTAIWDLFEIRPADDKPCVVHAIVLGQTTELGDAAEEQLALRLIRGFTSTGSGGATPTPAPLNPSDAAAGFSAETNNTTIATTGTTVDLHCDSWQIRSPYVWIFTPEMRPAVGQGNTSLVLRASAPADSITISGTLYVEELG